jgi:hypothetical protein
LNGDLVEEVYVQQPSGFVVKNGSGKVFKLKKAFYGLHQALRAWNAKLDSELTKQGLVLSETQWSMQSIEDQRRMDIL